MVSGLFLGYEMKHLITGESISKDKLEKVETIIIFDFLLNYELNQQRIIILII